MVVQRLCRRIDKFLGKPNFLEKRKMRKSWQRLHNQYADRFRNHINNWNDEYTQKFGRNDRTGDKDYYYFIYKKAKSICKGLETDDCYWDVYFWFNGEVGGPESQLRLMRNPNKIMRVSYETI